MSTLCRVVRYLGGMAEARRLNSGLWRIYLSSRRLARRPRNGTIATFYSLTEARRWWRRLHPQEPPLQETTRCAGCGSYIEPDIKSVTHAGRSYHRGHKPIASEDNVVPMLVDSWFLEWRVS